MPPSQRDPEIPAGVDEIIDIDAPFERHAPALNRAGPREPKPRGRSPLRALGVLGALAAAAIVVVALADYRPSPELAPSQAPASEVAVITPSPTPTEPLEFSPTPTDEVTPTVGPYWPAQIDLPVITIPAADVRSADQNPTATMSPSAAAIGPFVYAPFLDPSGGPGVIDIGSNTGGSIHLPSKKDEQYWMNVTDGHWLAILLVAGADANCPKSMDWRLLVAPLLQDGRVDTEHRGFTEVTSGVALGIPIPGQTDSCPLIEPPTVKLVGGVLGWIEDPVKASAGSVIHLRDLPAGIERRIKTKHHALNLALSSEAVAWLESTSAEAVLAGMGWTPNDGSALPEWYGMEASLSDPAAAPFQFAASGTGAQTLLPPDLVMDGSAVVATTIVPNTSSVTVVRIDPNATSEVIDDGSQDRRCMPFGADGGVLLLNCYWPNLLVSHDGNDQPLMMAATWTLNKGLRVVTVGPDMPLESWDVQARPGWVIVSGMNGYSAIPVSEIASR